MSIADHIATANAILNETPDDWETRLMLADLLDEAGDMEFAECQRWMVKNRKLPLRWDDGATVSHDWYVFSNPNKYNADSSEFCYLLPTQIGEHMARDISDMAIFEFSTRLEAELALSAALVKAGVGV